MTLSTYSAVVVTCEHGGNLIPVPYRPLFRPYQALLDSHRGYDPGALFMAKALATALEAPLLASTVSRLLVDLNRSVGHPHLYFEEIRKLPVALRIGVLEQYYHPYRRQAEGLIIQAIAGYGRVVHISCHSFTPELNGIVRKADIGLLYDSVRPREAEFCARWKSEIKACAPGLVVRRNYPYKGSSDGLTSWFRKRFPPEAYLGIELELKQRHLIRPVQQWAGMRELLCKSLRTVLLSPWP